MQSMQELLWSLTAGYARQLHGQLHKLTRSRSVTCSSTGQVQVIFGCRLLELLFWGVQN
jgi:hypothetical protein